MPLSAKYSHTNLIARDWKKLSRFYQDVFGCVPVPPERHYRGHDLELGTGVPDAELHGEHLRLPGCGNDGPTLEIYTYSIQLSSDMPHVNRPGFGHIAFAVDNVALAQKRLVESGGSTIGSVVTLQTSGGARVTWCYVRDPEGNIVELQSWSK